MRDRVEIGGRLRQRNAGFEPRLEDEVAAVDLRIRAVEQHRPPEIRRELGEARRHHADDRRRRAVQRERASDDRGVAVEELHPHLVGHDADGGAPEAASAT